MQKGNRYCGCEVDMALHENPYAVLRGIRGIVAKHVCLTFLFSFLPFKKLDQYHSKCVILVIYNQM